MLEEAIEATEVARLDLIPVSERSHPRHVLAHARTEWAAPLRKRPQSLERAPVVVLEQRFDDGIQAAAVLPVQFGQRVGAFAGGRPPREVSPDDAHPLHDVLKRRSRGIALEPYPHGCDRDACTAAITR